ncbi:hypothetical protein AG0111_0g2564 [Alternaria gaisen]|uniref:Uncharacterized protein n=1 Tax=Alternaria gaisen TaxID=167740 RepID=A0ACB6FW06_9PLEO|nr:hypothetical protein AG0111_0g2564 [Alternaria gaisen]
MCSYTKIHEWQTRLALIKPSEDPSAYLELSLVVVDLVDLNTGAIINHDTLVTYDALSYAWGTALPSAKCICDGNTILLRDNLDSALKYLRKPQDERYVWIDYLCINQDDLVEKAVQIPRMKNIFSKASTVIVWLGESLSVDNMIRRCDEECGPDVVHLTCPDHKTELWKSILGYTWFTRTWVRQEVFAAEKLNVCCPYFSSTWQLFSEALYSMNPLDIFPITSNFALLDNLYSLNKLYSSRRLELLDLLQQGRGFQASVPHDHIFSVLGIMDTPKHSKRGTIPVTYDKTYQEVCGDVTRYIIRESRSINILQLCTWQRDRSYAFDWPAVVWYSSMGHYLVSMPGDRDGELLNGFSLENPIREVNDSRPLENTNSSAKPSQSVSNRPLVLYGRVWGTVTGQLDSVKIIGPRSENPDRFQKRSVSAFVLDHEVDKSSRTEPSLENHVDIYREFLIDKSSVMESIFPDVKEYNDQVIGLSTIDNVWWRCYGSVSEGDIFVSLEPGPQNVLLRKCSISGDLFEVVAWNIEAINVSIQNGTYERHSYHVEEYQFGDEVGPRQRFEIR